MERGFVKDSILSHRRKNIDCLRVRHTIKDFVFGIYLLHGYRACTKGVSCDAFYCNFLLHIEGIALQGSFLLPFKSSLSGHRTCWQRPSPLESGFRMDHAIISKGVPRPLSVLPESQAYCIRLRLMNSLIAWSHAIRSKETGLQSPAPPLLKSPPALCRFDFRTAFSGLRKLSIFGIRLRRMVWGLLLSFFLCCSVLCVISHFCTLSVFPANAGISFIFAQ